MVCIKLRLRSANEAPVRKRSWKMSGGIVLGTETKFVVAEKAVLRGTLSDRRKATPGMALTRMPGEIGETAEELLANYGADAETVAAGQADTMLELGDLEAFEAWTAVAAAIRARRDGDFLAAG